MRRKVLIAWYGFNRHETTHDDCIKLLSLARNRFLFGTSSRFLCSTLMSLSKEHPVGSPEYNKRVSTAIYLQEWIMQMLNDGKTAEERNKEDVPVVTLEFWLFTKHFPGVSVADLDVDMLRKTRIAWIGWMIEELKKGD